MTDVSAHTVSEPAASDARALLRHMLATLAYRASRALRDAPDGFADVAAAPATRPAGLIVVHMGDLMDWALHLADGRWTWRAAGSRGGWDEDVRRFFDGVAALDSRLASDLPLGYPAEVLVQGPVADALTHVGQLTMLRTVAGAPVRPESYGRAEIVVGRIGIEQAAPRREFEGDASRAGE